MRIRPDQHASTEELAEFAAGDLSRRRAAGISAHLSQCEQCAMVLDELDAIPGVLAGTGYPPMPDHLSQRIEAAIRTEALQRISEMPAPESERRELPVRQPARAGWQLPRLRFPALRLAAALGAAAAISVGGYEIASNVGSGPGSGSAGGGPAAPPAAGQLTAGPEVTYTSGGARHMVDVMHSRADFGPASLGSQVAAAVRAAGAQSPRGTSAGPAVPGAGAAGTSPEAGCVRLVAGSRRVTLVDMARYAGKPATVIAVAAAGQSPAQAWVVGPQCSAATRDVIAHTDLPPG